MTVASFIASQRAGYGVANAVAWRALDVSESWFYKWRDRRLTRRDERTASPDSAVSKSFDAGSCGAARNGVVARS